MPSLRTWRCVPAGMRPLVAERFSGGSRDSGQGEGILVILTGGAAELTQSLRDSNPGRATRRDYGPLELSHPRVERWLGQLRKPAGFRLRFVGRCHRSAALQPLFDPADYQYCLLTTVRDLLRSPPSRAIPLLRDADLWAVPAPDETVAARFFPRPLARAPRGHCAPKNLSARVLRSRCGPAGSRVPARP
jgi:hypothetical protein